MLREFPLLIATAAKVSRKRGLWLVVRVKKDTMRDRFLDQHCVLASGSFSCSNWATTSSMWWVIIFCQLILNRITHQVSLALNLNLDHIIFCIDQCFAFTFRAEQRKRPEFRLPKQLQTCFCPTHRTSDPESFPPCIFCHFTSILSASIRLIKRSICSLSNPETALFSSAPS